MKKMVLLASLAAISLLLGGCLQYVPTPGEADMVEYIPVKPAHYNGGPDSTNGQYSNGQQHHSNGHN